MNLDYYDMSSCAKEGRAARFGLRAEDVKQALRCEIPSHISVPSTARPCMPLSFRDSRADVPVGFRVDIQELETGSFRIVFPCAFAGGAIHQKKLGAK